MGNIKNLFCFLIVCPLFFLLPSCSVTKQINKQAVNILLHDSVIKTGHVGISIYEPAKGKYWYNYDGDKYFVPASNVKLFSMYAGMKYLGDSLVGLRSKEDDTSISIYASGDPTFLHPDFTKQPVFEFLKQKGKQIILSANFFEENGLGKGWAWDDYEERYMAERSPFPMYGNLATFKLQDSFEIQVTPKYFKKQFERGLRISEKKGFKVYRGIGVNIFTIRETDNEDAFSQIPFITNLETIKELIKDTFHLMLNEHLFAWTLSRDSLDLKSGVYDDINDKKIKTIHSQPTDSLLKPMMHNSDNFFAEQTLLMASNEKLGYMNDEAIIDTLLSTDLKDIPQKPKWVDGSGLSRYNLFTPQDFIYILNKMKNEFGLERLKTILPTGNNGTLKNYYITQTTFIYAKTGSLSNHIALSGFLITRKNKLLIFSVLNNSFIGRATAVRREVEKFLKQIRENN